MPASFKIHDVINVSHLCPYRPPVTGQSSNPPEPIVIEGKPKYEVEEILDLQLKHGKLEYLVKWSEYTDDYNTWEPEANCTNSCEIIEDFYKKNPSALQKLCAGTFARLMFKKYENLTKPKKNAVSHLEVKT